jgi:hypothetical protein
MTEETEDTGAESEAGPDSAPDGAEDSAASQDDKRRAPRVDINPEFKVVGGAEGGLTYVSDLSEHGVFIHTQERVPVGQMIELRFTVLLDDPVVIQGFGTIMRHAENGMGVQFGQLSPQMVLRIHDAISREKARERIKAEVLTREATSEGQAAAFENQKTSVYAVPTLSPDDIDEIDSLD